MQKRKPQNKAEQLLQTDIKGKEENNVDAKILNGLSDLSSNNYRMSCTQRMIADIKADTTMDDTAKTELLAFADKVIAAETKISQDSLAMVAKYSTSDNIDPAQPDDGEDDYY